MADPATSHQSESAPVEELQRFQKVLLTRTVASVAFFALFIVLAIASIVTANQTLQMWVLAPAVVAILMMPRQSLPSSMPRPPQDPEAATLWAKLARMRIWLSSVRVVYLLTAVFLLLGLPELL